MSKEEEILKYSNPKTVFLRAKRLLGKDVEIKLSTRKDKKYMILNPDNDKWVHFGQIGYEDYTKHKDKLRRELFLKRNHMWVNKGKYTPAYLFFIILW